MWRNVATRFVRCRKRGENVQQQASTHTRYVLCYVREIINEMEKSRRTNKHTLESRRRRREKITRKHFSFFIWLFSRGNRYVDCVVYLLAHLHDAKIDSSRFHILLTSIIQFYCSLSSLFRSLPDLIGKVSSSHTSQNLSLSPKWIIDDYNTSEFESFFILLSRSSIVIIPQSSLVKLDETTQFLLVLHFPFSRSYPGTTMRERESKSEQT